MRHVAPHNHAGTRTYTVRTRRQNYDYALALLFPAMSGWVKLHQVASRPIKLYQDAASFIKMHLEVVPRSTIYQDVPRCTLRLAKDRHYAWHIAGPRPRVSTCPTSSPPLLSLRRARYGGISGISLCRPLLDRGLSLYCTLQQQPCQDNREGKTPADATNTGHQTCRCDCRRDW